MTWLIVAFGALALAGCDRFPAHVSGTVALDGQPLRQGTVAFHPTAGGVTVAATIDQHGRYTLQTGRETGLDTGEYRVTVTAISQPPGSGATAEEIAAAFLTPRRYSDPATSGITRVVESGSTTFDIELASR
jgi:hypothetical protein